MSFFWLLPLDGFQFNFLLRDSENDLYTEEMVFQLNLLGKAYFIARKSGLAMVRPASFDF